MQSKYYQSFVGLLLLVFIFCLPSSKLTAQHVFSGHVPENFVKPDLPNLGEFQVYSIKTNEILDYVSKQSGSFPFNLDLEGTKLEAILASSFDGSQSPERIAMTESGMVALPPRKQVKYQGFNQTPESGSVFFIFGHKMIGGAFMLNGTPYALEPLWHHVEDAPTDLYVLYDVTKAIIPDNPICGTNELEHQCTDPDHQHEDEAMEESAESGRSQPGCKEVEYASALDWLFVNKYGSEQDAWDRVDFVMGLVEFQYTGHFDNDYIYIRTHEFASTCSTCDPSVWTNTTNSSTLLTNFRSWGQGGGFGNTAYDVAGLWTNRTFQSGVVGIAYVGGLCNSFKYHCLMDFSSQSWAMRVMVSHEIGHNFNCQHDASNGFIMSPSVNNTTQWSNASKITINNYTAGSNGNCMTNCPPSAPPVADFTASPTSGCLPMVVNFTDLSTGNPTSWSWSFPGGTPATSTIQNPIVTYSVKGEYNVTLTASNAAGSNTITKFTFITVDDKPVANFDEIADENIVSFINLTDNGTSYHWDFGDGETSTEENPVHVYLADGVYLVVLTATNNCGLDVYSKYIEIVTTPEADFSSDKIKGCSPLTVQFEDQSTPNTTHWAWSFPGGTPDTSNAINPLIVYHTPGVYTVSLTASNSAGSNTRIRTNYITVEGPPTAAFNYSLNGDTVSFMVVGTPDSVFWDFGDGDTSSIFNPKHVYANEGIYNVTLTVFTLCGQGSITQEVEFVLPPLAGFSAQPLQGCTPLTVTFSEEASANASQFEWHFPGGNPATSTDTDPVVVYNTPGKYDVTLIVSNAAGADTLVKSNYVDALASPVAGFSVDVQNGNEAAFTNGSQYGVSYAWDFGDGNSSNEESPMHTYQEEGEFTVILTVTNPCGTSTYQLNVMILLPPQAGFSADKTQGCKPLVVHFTDQSSPSVTHWEWTFEGGTPASSNEKNPVVTYDNPGLFNVKLVVSNPIGNGELEIDDYVNVLTTPIAAFNGANEDGTVTFTNLSQFGQNYSWDFGDGITSNEEHPIHTYKEEGFYFVTLTVTNECGLNVLTELIEVIFAPVGAFDSDDAKRCAESMTIQFYDQSIGQANAWQWHFEGGTPEISMDQNPIVTYNTPGVYDVMMIVGGPGGKDTVLLEDYVILAAGVPNADFVSTIDDYTAFFANTTDIGNSWYWTFGDGSSSSEKHPQHTYNANGIYDVTLIASNPCGADTISYKVTIQSVSVELPSFLKALNLMPNPANGLIYLEMEGHPVGQLHYRIVNALGQTAEQGYLNFVNTHLRQELNLQHLSVGKYYLQIYNNSEFVSKPFIMIR